MQPIMFHNIPHDQKGDIAHTRVVCEVRPTKADPNRTRVTIRGNTINYIGDCGTKTSSLEIVKLVINSTPFGPEKQWPKLPTRQGNHGKPSTRLIHL
jgi:hypothetical protein